jgi:hypothetical protein
MKRFFILIGCLFLLFCNKATDKKIIEIESINNLAISIDNDLNSLQTKEFNLSDIVKSTDGSDLIAYYMDTVLQKLSVNIRGEMGHVQEDYYYRNDTLQLIHKLEVTLDKPYGSETGKKENWYYYSNVQLFAATDTSKVIKEITQDLQAEANDLVAMQLKYIELTKKRPNVYVRGDYSFALSNLPEGIVCEENEQDSSDVDLTIIIYNSEKQKVGQLIIIPWCAASQLAIGDSELMIDGAPANKTVLEEVWNDKPVIHYAFETMDIIVIAKIRKDLEEWFEKNFHFVMG